MMRKRFARTSRTSRPIFTAFTGERVPSGSYGASVALATPLRITRDRRYPVTAQVTWSRVNRQIVLNSSGSIDAPPTSAPSMSSCAMSDAMVRALTEPP